MSTRAIYTFIEESDAFEANKIAIYKHHDGYPIGAFGTLGAIQWLLNGRALAKVLHKAGAITERDAMVAGFLATNTAHMRLIGPDNLDYGIEYDYEIIKFGKAYGEFKIYEHRWKKSIDGDEFTDRFIIYRGTLDGAIEENIERWKEDYSRVVNE